jgi:uncharacterized protein YdhG (YjbR/CyaY superfamily)
MAPPTTVAEYLASLPADRRAALEAVRKVIKKHVQPGFKETLDFGMISWGIPLSRYPETYNGHPLGLVALASQKSHMAVYLMCVYSDPQSNREFLADYARSGKKLDMGKSCVRFKKVDDLALDAIGKAIARTSVDQLIAGYEASRGATTAGKKAAKAISSRDGR